jgi:hypothetical protein
MATTYEIIASVNVGSGGAANIEFTSIPSTFNDLSLVMSIRNNDSTRNVGWVNIQFNNSTSNRSWKDIYGNGSNTFSTNDATMRIGSAQGNLATADTFGSATLYIPNYAGSNFKSSSGDGVAERNNATTNTGLDANLWSDIAAITSIKLVPGDGTGWVQHSTAYLYGIKNS